MKSADVFGLLMTVVMVLLWLLGAIRMWSDQRHKPRQSQSWFLKTAA
jgi:hypothetical protein